MSEGEQAIRAALDAHWAASDANAFDLEHQIYRDDAVLEYPQSGERIRGRGNIQASRVAQPSAKRFTVRRIVGAGNLWVTEFILAYDGRPSYSVSVMEFQDGKVARAGFARMHSFRGSISVVLPGLRGFLPQRGWDDGRA
jgi:hypothetical protein